jgi:hypothetical protein
MARAFGKHLTRPAFHSDTAFSAVGAARSLLESSVHVG